VSGSGVVIATKVWRQIRRLPGRRISIARRAIDDGLRGRVPDRRKMMTSYLLRRSASAAAVCVLMYLYGTPDVVELIAPPAFGLRRPARCA
jgi:hypothetical protein